MRFTTIWSIPGLPLTERIDRTLDWAAMELADILPKRAVYWITMVQIGKATMTSQNVPATSLDNILTNLGNVRNGKPLEQFVWERPEGDEFSLLPDGEIPTEQQVLEFQQSLKGIINDDGEVKG